MKTCSECGFTGELSGEVLALLQTMCRFSGDVPNVEAWDRMVELATQIRIEAGDIEPPNGKVLYRTEQSKVEMVLADGKWWPYEELSQAAQVSRNNISIIVKKMGMRAERRKVQSMNHFGFVTEVRMVPA